MAQRLGRIVAVALLSALVLPVASAKGDGREEVVAYEALNAGTGAGPAGAIIAQAKFEPHGARYLDVGISDDAGGSVLARVIQDSEVTTFCTSTPEPVLIRPDFPVTVRMYAGRCFDGAPSVVTSGTVTARLTRTKPYPGPRTETRPYNLSAPEVTGKDGNSVYATAVTYTVGPKERRVDLTIEDASGLPVFARVEHGVGGFPSEAGIPVCGQTDRPLHVEPRTSITVFIYLGGCSGGDPGNPTFGEVRATFTRR